MGSVGSTLIQAGSQYLQSQASSGSGGGSSVTSSIVSGASTGAAIGSIIPGVGTVIGGAIGAIGGFFSSAFGPSPENADKSGALWTQYVQGSRTTAVAYPTKSEVLQAAKQGGWEGHIQAAINAAYDQTTGTWNYSGDDWRGAITGVNPITAEVFKGHTEHHTLNSNVVSQTAIVQQQPSLNSMFTTSNNQQGGALSFFSLGQNPNDTTSTNPIVKIVLIVAFVAVAIFGIFKMFKR